MDQIQKNLLFSATATCSCFEKEKANFPQFLAETNGRKVIYKSLKYNEQGGDISLFKLIFMMLVTKQ